jgi:hypothetical protein
VSDITLVVQSDDFGMCHAVNEGIVDAFTGGILTQVSTMVPVPWFAEAAELARKHGIPAGIHLTLTCDWDRLRWGPLTDGPSLRDEDGMFHSTVLGAREVIDHDEALSELIAQVERFRRTGLEPTHFDCHMGRVSVRSYTAICERYGKPFIYKPVEPYVRFDSIGGLSERDGAGKTAWLLDHIERLEPGTHLLVCHAARPGPEMASVCSPDWPPVKWAEEYRKSDLEALTAAEVRAAIERRDIRLAAVRDLP